MPSSITRVRSLHADDELVALARDGDDPAFEQLYHRYHRRIAAFVAGMVGDQARAEDVTQEVFFAALRRLRSSDAAIEFKPWVYEIARNACIDQFRRGKNRTEVSFDAEGGMSEDDRGRLAARPSLPSPAQSLEQKASLEHLTGALGQLAADHHAILVMREFEGRSYREIGERLDMSAAAVESRLFRARRRLSEEYRELVSGERCEKVQMTFSTLESDPEAKLNARQRRQLGVHVSHCQPCRRHGAAADALHHAA